MSEAVDGVTAVGRLATPDDGLKDAMPTSDAVELDWGAGGVHTKGSIERAAARFGVEAEIVNGRGPGGGNPVVRFTGHPMRLGALLWVYFTGEPDDGTPDSDEQEFLDFVR